MHVFGNVVQAILDGEVPGFKPVHLGFGQILQISFSSLPGEEDIVLRPENDSFRLSLPKKSLPFRIKRNIGSVVVEEIQMNASSVWPLQGGEVRIPIIRADQLG